MYAAAIAELQTESSRLRDGWGQEVAWQGVITSKNMMMDVRQNVIKSGLMCIKAAPGRPAHLQWVAGSHRCS